MPVRAVLTTVDQGVASVSNFAVGVAVARVAGVAGLGSYSLAYTAWLVLAAVHRSLVTDPMAIENDLNQPDAPSHVRSGLAAELTLGLGCTLVFLAIGGLLLASGQHAYGVGFMAIAPWLPFLLTQDYWRWVGFMKADPAKSLLNDLLFLVVQTAMFAMLLALGVHSTALVIGGWGVGALVGAAYGLRQFRSRPTLHRGAKRLRMRWRMSKWLLGSSTSTWGGAQASVILTGIILGPVGLGGLKAATSLVSGPALVLVQAGGSVGLPEASRALSERGWRGLRRVERFVTLAGLVSVTVVAVVIAFFGKTLLSDFYGHEFARYSGIADILAISFVVMSLGLGAILSLKATRQTRHLFTMGMVALIGAVIAVSVLAPLDGLRGAAWAMVIANCLTTTTVVCIHLRHSKVEAQRMTAEAPRAEGRLPVALPEMQLQSQGQLLAASLRPITPRGSWS